MNYPQRPHDHRVSYAPQDEPAQRSGVSIGVRMMIPAVLVILIMTTVLGLNLQRQKQALDSLGQLGSGQHLLHVDTHLHRALLAERTLLVTSPNSDHFSELLSSRDESIHEARRLLQDYGSESEAKSATLKLKRLLASFSEWEQASDRVIDQLRVATTEDRQRAAADSLDLSDERFNAVRQQLNQLIEQADAALAHRAGYSSQVLTGVTIGGMVLSALLLLILVLTTRDRIKAVVGVVNEVASGGVDLTKRMEIPGNDELSQIATAFNGFMGQVHDTIGSARIASQSVALATTEMTRGNNDLAHRTESQAAGLQTTASSMGDITSSVEQNAKNSQRASEVASKARETAEHGGKQVQEVIDSMHTIADSSREISDIVSVVEEIAFQTNLLALNAAVEAARAGDHGVGFAVVATEVRTLAQRSAESADEIKRLIGESLNKIAVGNEQADRSGEALDELLEAVEQVADLLTEISGTTQEQSSSIKKVNTAISEIEGITQRNTGLVQEAAVSTQELEKQAQGLNDILASFKVRQSFR